MGHLKSILRVLMCVVLSLTSSPATTTAVGVLLVFPGTFLGASPASADTTSCYESLGTWRCTGPNGTQSCYESLGTLRCSGPSGTTTCYESLGTYRCSGAGGSTSCYESLGTIRCNGPDGTTTCYESLGTLRCSGPSGTTTCYESLGTYRCSGAGGLNLPLPNILKPTPTPTKSYVYTPTPQATPKNYPLETREICTSSKSIEETCLEYPDWIYEACVRNESGILQQKIGNKWERLWRVKTEKNSTYCDNTNPNLLSINANTKNAKGTIYFRVVFDKTPRIGSWNLNFKARVVSN
jgi:hypothetical protein